MIYSYVVDSVLGVKKDKWDFSSVLSIVSTLKKEL